MDQDQILAGRRRLLSGKPGDRAGGVRSIDPRHDPASEAKVDLRNHHYRAGRGNRYLDAAGTQHTSVEVAGLVGADDQDVPDGDELRQRPWRTAFDLLPLDVQTGVFRADLGETSGEEPPAGLDGLVAIPGAHLAPLRLGDVNETDRRLIPLGTGERPRQSCFRGTGSIHSHDVSCGHHSTSESVQVPRSTVSSPSSRA